MKEQQFNLLVLSNVVKMNCAIFIASVLMDKPGIRGFCRFFEVLTAILFVIFRFCALVLICNSLTYIPTMRRESWLFMDNIWWKNEKEPWITTDDYINSFVSFFVWTVLILV